LVVDSASGSVRVCSESDPDSLCPEGGELPAGGPVRLLRLLKTSTPGGGSGFGADRRRPKRSVFLHGAVKICPQETADEVLASHRRYYQLRGTSPTRSSLTQPSLRRTAW